LSKKGNEKSSLFLTEASQGHVVKQSLNPGNSMLGILEKSTMDKMNLSKNNLNKPFVDVSRLNSDQ